MGSVHESADRDRVCAKREDCNNTAISVSIRSIVTRSSKDGSDGLCLGFLIKSAQDRNRLCHLLSHAISIRPISKFACAEPLTGKPGAGGAMTLKGALARRVSAAAVFEALSIDGRSVAAFSALIFGEGTG